MANPFDKTFFRLLLGFTFMLSLGFAVLFILGEYSGDNANISAKTETVSGGK
jgi:hypothetical protein